MNFSEFAKELNANFSDEVSWVVCDFAVVQYFDSTSFISQKLTFYFEGLFASLIGSH